jgi:hypothetical protein
MSSELVKPEECCIKWSESKSKIFSALAKAQMEITPSEKNRKNPHFKSDYSDLLSTWEACREALCANELSVMQTVGQKGDKSYLFTTLGHSSGEWATSEIPLLNTQANMQGLGSALTYARRYGISAICGVCPSDDDGNAATFIDTIQLADICDQISQDYNPRELYNLILKQVKVQTFSRIPGDKHAAISKWISDRQKEQRAPKPTQQQ